jgi:hypothetical protein
MEPKEGGNMKNALRSCIACLLVAAAAPALALYRCGNVYQDKPCESGTQVNLTPSGRPQTSPAPAALPVRSPPANAATFAIVCSRIGEQAQRITWKREGGATMEQQLAERATVLSPADQAKTVQSVYARRGSAPEIRSQIEAECMAEKAREAEAAETLNQLRKQAGDTPAAPAAGSAAPLRSAENAAQPSAGNKPSASYCRSLKRAVDDVRARLAQGGSGRQMEMLQNERRSAEQSYRDSGCS